MNVPDREWIWVTMALSDADTFFWRTPTNLSMSVWAKQIVANHVAGPYCEVPKGSNPLICELKIVKLFREQKT